VTKVSLRAVGPTGRRLKCLKLKSRKHNHESAKIGKPQKNMVSRRARKGAEKIRQDQPQLNSPACSVPQ
jgi:hypothetical protein